MTDAISYELLDDIAAWMAVGIIIAGVMLTYIPPDWLAQHPLTWHELRQERDAFERLGLRLRVD